MTLKVPWLPLRKVTHCSVSLLLASRATSVSVMCASPLARGISLSVSQPCINRSGDQEVGTRFIFAHGVLVSALSRRYVRFFPDGHVMMLTTPEEPQSIVPRLRTRNTRWWPSAVSCPLHILGGSLQIM